jgi:hypothetical protein
VSEFKFDSIELDRNLELLPEQIEKTITLTVDYASDYGEDRMKKQAPWYDKTTNARSGLFTATKHKNVGQIQQHSILFSHKVSYGIWLEIKRETKGGRPVIMPTLVPVGRDLMKALEGLLNHPGDAPAPNLFPKVSTHPGAQGVKTAKRASVHTRKTGRNRGGGRRV